jgi:hypothetical protein
MMRRRVVAVGPEQAEKQGAGREAVQDFVPVPRKFRHDGWTPERQRAFIAALADTGCVSRAAAMVNMAQTNCYTLRRAPGAEGFRRAWDAALDLGLARLKDIAFERAIDGYLVPVFDRGKLAGYRRRYNDALLMFCLRHYGQDAQGRRTTINYFSTRATAGTATQAGTAAQAQAESTTTTVRTVVAGAAGGVVPDQDQSARALAEFGGVTLDAQAQAEIQATLLALAARARANEALAPHSVEGMVAALDSDPAGFVRAGDDMPLLGLASDKAPGPDLLEPGAVPLGEAHWTLAGAAVDAMWNDTVSQLELLGQPTGVEPNVAEVPLPQKRPGSGRRRHAKG